MRARNKIFHIDCFRCVVCSCPLQTGEEFALRDDGLYCKSDNDSAEQTTASGRESPPSPSACFDSLEDSKDNIVLSEAKCTSADGSDNSTGKMPVNNLLRVFSPIDIHKIYCRDVIIQYIAATASSCSLTHAPQC